MATSKPRSRKHHRKSSKALKDRLIQTRVAQELESALKDVAR
jgi:hypothetical protein